MAFILALLIASPQADQHPASTIDSAALYLNKAYSRLQQLRLEADRTGNMIKYNECQKEIEEEFATSWHNKKVTWLMQVESIGNFRAPEYMHSKHDHLIQLVNDYTFKNKARLSVAVDIKSNIRDNIRNGFPPDDTIEFDEKWARTLKRGDWIVVDGTLSKVSLGYIAITPSKYSKYTPPKKK